MQSVRTIVLSAWVMLISFVSYAQAPDSIRQKVDSLVMKNTSKADSTFKEVNGKIDASQSKLTQMLDPKAQANALALRLRSKSAKRDSLRAIKKLDSLKGNAKHKIDSLKAQNLPTAVWTRKLDSLSQLNPNTYWQEVESTMSDATQKANQPVNKLESEVNGKLALMNKEGGAAANLPGAANLGELKVPTANVDLAMEAPTPNLDLSTASLENPLKEEVGDVSEVKQQLAEVKNIPNDQLGKVASQQQVATATGAIENLNTTTDQAQAYGEDIRNVAKGNMDEVKALPNAMEDRAKNIEEVKALQVQQGEMAKFQEMTKEENATEKLKAIGKEQAVTYAKDHFAGQEKILMEAMGKMEKLKSKYPSLDSAKNLPKYKPNAVRGKPFVERLVPAVTFQLQKETNTWLDYTVSAGYRITGRITAGLGWNERVGIAKKLRLTSANRIYGPRVYLNGKVWNNFSVQLELEKMRTLVEATTLPQDVAARIWVWSAFAGIKKTYTFSKRVKGNFQFLYNLYDDHYNSPYVSRFNVRFGFEFPLKKKVKTASNGSVGKE